LLDEHKNEKWSVRCSSKSFNLLIYCELLLLCAPDAAELTLLLNSIDHELDDDDDVATLKGDWREMVFYLELGVNRELYDKVYKKLCLYHILNYSSISHKSMRIFSKTHKCSCMNFESIALCLSPSNLSTNVGYILVSFNSTLCHRLL